MEYNQKQILAHNYIGGKTLVHKMPQSIGYFSQSKRKEKFPSGVISR